MTFAEQLRPHIERIGATRAAELCGVTPRSIRLWLRGEGNPNLATQVGVISLLSSDESAIDALKGSTAAQLLEHIRKTITPEAFYGRLIKKGGVRR
jgi:hypothetical protein